jgi:uncharacterized membrane protein YfcA
MLTLSALATIGPVIFVASVLSGVFGMAGGMILLGVILVYLDVVTGMILFGLIQTTAGGWRAAIWWRYVKWSVVWRYLVGATVTFILFRWIALVPDKAVVYIGLGLMPILADRLPDRFALDITRPGVPYVAGLVLQAIQLMAGATGVLLDTFFQRTGLDRKTIIASKAITQVASHIYRVAYFASIGSLAGAALPWWAYLGAVCLAIAGTSIAGVILHHMTDDGFRKWSRRLILTVSVVYVLRGLWLLL